MEKTKNIFAEYRRGVLPDTYVNSFEGVNEGAWALLNQVVKQVPVEVKAEWEICLVDWSRMFRVYLN